MQPYFGVIGDAGNFFMVTQSANLGRARATKVRESSPCQRFNERLTRAAAESGYRHPTLFAS